MADRDPKVVEWEEEKEEEAGGNLQSKTNCKKRKENPKYHDGMIPVENVRKALEASKTDPSVSCAPELHPFRYMHERPQRLDSADEVDKSVNKIFEELSQTSSLTKDDAVILNHYRSYWESVFDAVVKLRVKKAHGKISNGTGFLISRPPGYNQDRAGSMFDNFAVMTNFHVVKQNNDHFPVVEAEDIEVIFFYDCDQSDVVTCRVSEISGIYSPSVSGMPTSEKLDFAMLYIKHPDNEAKKKKLEDLEPLLFEESGRIQAAEENQIVDKKRLFVIGHPHGVYKHIAFGELKTDTNNLYQEWNEASKGVFHSVEHNVATCSGSSGSPVIMIGLKEGKPVDAVFVPSFVPFLHFRGSSNAGDAASMQSIMPAIRKSLSQNN